MKISKIAVLVAACFTLLGNGAMAAKAEPKAAAEPVAKKAPSEAELKKLIEPRLGDGVKIDSIKPTSYSGLLEVRIGSDIFYTDAKGDYLIMGQVFKTENMRNLTKERTDELSKIKFNDLPFGDAIKIVKGDGKRVMAIFEDPNCGYCKRFRQTLAEVDNVTVYSFLIPILGGDSPVKAKNIWCAADNKVALEEWMVKGKEAAAAAAECKNPADKLAELGRKLKVNGTPTIFFTDGSRVPGAIDAKGLEQKFAALK